MKKHYSRRAFLKETSLAAAGVAAAAHGLPARAYSRIAGANERVNFALVGLHGRAHGLLSAVAACKNGAISHICDVDRNEMDKFALEVQKKTGQAPQQEKDIRLLLESKDVDAIAIATPDHWHAPMSIMALQAGKHVYVEKPCSHNPAEGALLVRAQKKYGFLVQMGNQQRSSTHTMEAIQKIRDGSIGRVYYGKAWYSNARKSIGRGREVPVPPHLDWDLWQGPAPRRPYKDNIHPYNWHWFWHWGTGETLNNGTHEVDLCRWALDVGYPIRLNSAGGRYHFRDDWEFYDTIVTNFEYADKMITWEGKSCSGKKYYHRGRGVTIHGTEGTMLIDRNGYEIYDLSDRKVFTYAKAKTEGTMDVVGGGSMTDAHVQNFIDAIRTGIALNAPVAEGNISVTMLQLSNIAWKLGRKLDLDPATGRIIGDAEAAQLTRREYEPGWEPRV